MTGQNNFSKKAIDLKQEAERIAKILGQAQECLKVMEYLTKGDPDIDVYNRHAGSFWGFTAWVYSNRIVKPTYPTQSKRTPQHPKTVG